MSLILLVDDDRDIREAMELALEDHGHQVISAANGKEALHILQQGLRPDLVVLDLMMPIMTGWELREKMLGDPALSSIPTVVISGDTRATQHSADLGAAAFLAKPFELDDLLGHIVEAAALPSSN